MKNLKMDLTITIRPPMSAEQAAEITGENPQVMRPIPASVSMRSKPFKTASGILFVAGDERFIIGEKLNDRNVLNMIAELLESADRQYCKCKGMDYSQEAAVNVEDGTDLSEEVMPSEVIIIVKTVCPPENPLEPWDKKYREIFKPAVGWKFEYIDENGEKKQYGDFVEIENTTFPVILEAIRKLLTQYRSVYAEVENGYVEELNPYWK